MKYLFILFSLLLIMSCGSGDSGMSTGRDSSGECSLFDEWFCAVCDPTILHFTGRTYDEQIPMDIAGEYVIIDGNEEEGLMTFKWDYNPNEFVKDYTVINCDVLRLDISGIITEYIRVEEEVL